ncbi:hypothetical protein ILUMI_11873 [Ignelater luminosus]|uniref:C-type lectin domain-containing protein n=1 Tax=Ignelater luminosus TaxID=2038154 RepID=A0A8K0CZJ0_IGNLU|nr:hypothetical protein ILUMI_11873 [Ignelater luminosus]
MDSSTNTFLLLILVFPFDGIQCTETDEDILKTPFIEPDEISDIEDLFTRGSSEYIFVNLLIDYHAAKVLCNGTYGGRLAVIETTELAEFLAEALSETNLFLDHLWVGGKGINRTWYWYEGGTIISPIDKQLIDLYFVNHTKSVKATDRNCLAMGRKNHDVPYFPELKCDVQRPFMCEREAGSWGNNGTTHPGWIRIGNRLYKIFQERVSWVDATARCIMFDRNSRLAVLTNYRESQVLGRFLLIGRPSLENAWIGAKHYQNHYAFSQENIVLSNSSNPQGYPPWRNGTVRKTKGCILLDRHLSNITYFIEARCERLRPYICYKKDLSENDSFVDMLIEEFGYRIFLNKLPWNGAKSKCDKYKVKYEGKLVEIRERKVVSHLIYIMGENKTTFQHMWLGGIYDSKSEKWFWDSDRSLVDLNQLDWLVNTTYFENVEKYNTCLNMDRENHIKAIHYGTVCEYAQHFVCSFSREKLIQLKTDEINIARQDVHGEKTTFNYFSI